ncbi:MAG: hypothetical protein RR052_04230, partial [Oscillospiraceae bacterium]
MKIEDISADIDTSLPSDGENTQDLPQVKEGKTKKPPRVKVKRDKSVPKKDMKIRKSKKPAAKGNKPNGFKIFLKKLKEYGKKMLLRMGVMVEVGDNVGGKLDTTSLGLKGKITRAVICVVLLCSIVIAIGSVFLMYSSSMSTLEKTITQTAKVAAERTEQELNSYKNIAFEMGCNDRLTSSDSLKRVKVKLLKSRIKCYDFESGNIIQRDGISLLDGKNYSKEPFFDAAIHGEVFLSDAVYNEENEKWEISISAPMWSNGMPNTAA